MKTANLKGALLDYWVAAAKGHKARIVGPRCMVHERADGMWLGEPGHGWHFSPSTVWNHAGPIIEQESISCGKRVDMPAGPRQWDAFIDSTFNAQARSPHAWWGATPLIAAMRAYVASKFGDEVPDDLALP